MSSSRLSLLLTGATLFAVVGEKYGTGFRVRFFETIVARADLRFWADFGRFWEGN